MRVKFVLVVSLLMNVLLAVAFYDLFRASKANPRIVRTLNPVAITSAPTFRIAKTNVLIRAEPGFSWRDIESPDYPMYVLNLRSIGCPETTVRDIIVADVSQLYARKRAAE